MPISPVQSIRVAANHLDDSRTALAAGSRDVDLDTAGIDELVSIETTSLTVSRIIARGLSETR